MSSSVKTDWNCLFNTLAFEQSVLLANKRLFYEKECQFFSLCMALIYNQEDLGLSFRLAATISHM